MTLYTLSIRRPVLAVVMSLVIVIFGAIAFTKLGVREYPSVDPAVITITTEYPGANADVIESQITQPLEEKVNSVPGLKTLTSTSREGRSTIVAELELGVDLETAANDVRDKVSNGVRELPPDAEPPSVAKADADRQPVVFLGVRSDHRDLLQLTDYAENVLKERLQTIAGVAEVDIWGSKRYSMRLWLDPARLAAYGLSPVDVRETLRRENVELPAGRIEGASVELTVRTLSRLDTVEEFNDLVLAEVEGRIVRLRDVGYAEIAPQNMRTLLRRDGIPMVGVVLRPQPGANQIEIVDEFYKRKAQIERDLPADLRLDIGFDISQYIRDSVEEVQQTFFIAMALVVSIIFLFLRDWRTTLIPALVIPVSMVGVFLVIYLAGFSINVLTLLGMVLAIGLVVDDAIVVLENIYAKIEAGHDPIRAGVVGTREIFFAVIATTLALVAVFLPIFFLGGLTGRLFREFGVTIAGAVVISSFAALTLAPMACTRLLRKRAKQPWVYRVTEPGFRALTRAYRSTLGGFLGARWLAFPVLVGAVALIWLVGRGLPSELAPLEDRGSVRLSMTAPEGASYEYMDAYVQEAVAMLQREVPEAEGVIAVTSPGFGAASSVNSAFARVKLVPAEERQRSQQEIAQVVSDRLKEMTGARAFATQSPTIGTGRRGQPVQFVLQAPSFERLREVLPDFLDDARARPELQAVQVDLKFDKPELQIQIDRDRARDLGVSALDIGQTLSAALSGQRFGYFLKDGKQYWVIGQLLRENRDEPLDLASLYVKGAGGQLVQLDNLVRLVETSSPPQIYHYNRYVSATLSASLAPGKTIGDGIAAMREVAGATLDDTFQTALAGESLDYEESASSLGFVFLLALVLIFLVLAAQFESFRDPMIIILTVPLALAGGLLALWLTGQTLNIFSQIGLIMLLGLVTKNGILIVEFANQRRQAGDSILEAARNAAAARFRPVLMTSLSTILGILPIALALGAGAESRKSMGIAVIGGLLLGSLLTLYVIPAMYTYLASRRVRADVLADLEADDSGAGVEPEPALAREKLAGTA
ncbi:MAG: efflux RND transporter permease subunit [Holophagales bacterium]|nr:efflux RND transporter permease subunit [Holophagales bacterium]